MLTLSVSIKGILRQGLVRIGGGVQGCFRSSDGGGGGNNNERVMGGSYFKNNVVDIDALFFGPAVTTDWISRWMQEQQ